ncbi:MAG: aminotransferase class IV [Bacteroidota bacterium]
MKNLFFPLNEENNSAELKEIYLNRAFLYGDGFFESMRWHKNKISFYDDHFARIQKSFEILKLNATHLDKQVLEQQIKSVIQAMDITNDARVRLTFFRVAEGYYTPGNSKTALLIQPQSWENNEYLLNEKSISMGVFRDHYKSSSSLSNIKSLNSLVYVLAGIYVKEKGWDDGIILNDLGNVCEATSSNLFIVKDEIIYTPQASDGCVEGVMRKQAIRFAKEAGIKLREKTLTVDDVKNADEIFLTNGIRGFITVGNFEGRSYKTEMVKQLHSCLANI